MAEIRKIARRPELSTFQREASTGGSASLLALAGSMNAAYERLRPAAMQRMTQEAEADWAGQARRDMGNPGGMVTASGGSSFRSALRQAESGGNSTVVNSEGFGGLYQWGQPRLDDYNAATGQNVTFDQFLANSDIQEAAQDWHEGDILGQLGGYVGTTVNGQVLDEGAIIGMAHLGGTGGARQYIETGGAYNPSDSNGTSLSDYAQRFGGMSVSGGGNVTMSTQSAPATIIQTADGSLQPRLYSPASGEILQAYNAAAQVLYRNEAELETTAALMNLSNQYTLDPDGFQQAARGYIEETLKNVPDMFRPELRAVMTEQVQRRALGILEDKQADIRQRAANSNQALIEKHSQALSDAMVAGNPDAILKAENDLRTQLAVRESLPGLSFTREQANNIIFDARDRADRVRVENQKKAKTEMDGQLRMVIAAADAGLNSPYDALLIGPFTDLMDPDLVADATAAKMLQEAMPGYLSKPPEQLDAIVAQMEQMPVTSPQDVKTVEAVRRARDKRNEAFKTDPIAAQAAYLPNKPPELPPIDDPAAYAAGLQARLANGQWLNANGFTSGVPLFSIPEREAAGLPFKKDVPADLKMDAVTAIVAGLGKNASLYFEQASTDDRMSMFVGKMLASTVDDKGAIRATTADMAVAGEILRGQEMVHTDLVDKPTVPAFAEVSVDAAVALSGLSFAPDVSEAAAMIYVARGNSTLDPKSEEGKKAMEASIQAAFGQKTDPLTGRTTGGYQKVGSRATVLPPDVAGDEFSRALQLATGSGRKMAPENAVNWGAKAFAALGMGGQSAATMLAPEGIPDPTFRPDIWEKAGALSVPERGGEPIPPERASSIFARPVGNGAFYQLFIEDAMGRSVPLHVANSELPFLFDPRELIKAAQ